LENSNHNKATVKNKVTRKENIKHNTARDEELCDVKGNRSRNTETKNDTKGE
jgi:hypothetical protein